MRPFTLIFLFGVTGILLFVHNGKRGSGDRSRNESHVRELGTVRWFRGFDQARQRAERENKPLLVLFQEVPGCSTCIGYGDQVLSHPLIVEAIESYFVPLAVYNNISGDDKKTMQEFGEPAWNNPVVRIVSPDRKPLTRRLDGDYSQIGLVDAIVDALRARDEAISPYIHLLQKELSSQKRTVDQTTIVTSCFWAGEVAFASIDGIVSTRPGYLNGEEAVDVEFDPSIVSYKTLVEKAQGEYCTKKIAARNEKQYSTAKNIQGTTVVMASDHLRPDSENKYYLQHSDLRFLPMTEIQQLKVNAALFNDGDPLHYLSPQQITLYRYIKDHPGKSWKNRIGTSDFTSAWDETVGMAE